MRTEQQNHDRRRRRRRRRIQIVILYTLIAIGLAWFFESQATTTIIFVRHAEKADTGGDDPPLSEAGERRVAELTREMLEVDVIAGIDAVYATPYRRTQQTAQPIADALGLPINTYDAIDPADEDATEDFVDGVLREHKGGIVLIVGHSNTVPAMIAGLGGHKNVPEIAEDEYDNIYILAIPWFGKTKTIRMRYGEPYVPPVAAAEPVTPP